MDLEIFSVRIDQFIAIKQPASQSASSNSTINNSNISSRHSHLHTDALNEILKWNICCFSTTATATRTKNKYMLTVVARQCNVPMKSIKWYKKTTIIIHTGAHLWILFPMFSFFLPSLLYPKQTKWITLVIEPFFGIVINLNNVRSELCSINETIQ